MGWRAEPDPSMDFGETILPPVDPSRLAHVTLLLDPAEVRMHEAIGQGGMGVVYRAEQTSLGRDVAVKTLLPERIDGESIAKLVREAWLLGRMEHPNIVPVHLLRLDERGQPMIVMKRVEGRVWRELIREQPLEAALRILVQVCNAVHFAHSRGVLHRDIKPANVMVGTFGEVYLLDWGVAVSLREDPRGLLPHVGQTEGLAGTPIYMAPEMLDGEPASLGVHTDVYLLGATLHHVLAGDAPHRAFSQSEVLARIRKSAP
jgi:serine/threonine protein kinase